LIAALAFANGKEKKSKKWVVPEPLTSRNDRQSSHRCTLTTIGEGSRIIGATCMTSKLRDDLVKVYKDINHFIQHDIDSSLYIAPIIDIRQPNAYRQTTIAGLSKFQTLVKNELEALLGSSEENISSNAPYLISVWESMRRAVPPIVAIHHMIDGVKVDIIAQGGLQLIKVNTYESRFIAE
jgi:hypothetical protein